MDLRDLLATRYFHNSAEAWLTAAAIFAGVTLLMLVVRRLTVTRLLRLAQRTNTDVDDLAVDLIRRTRVYFILAVALVAATLALTLPEGVERGRRVFAVIAVILQLGVWGNGLVSYWIDRYVRKTGRTGAAATTLGALGFLARLLLWSLLLLVGLDNLGFQITTIITGLGVGGIAIALAVQNILGDLFGALSIVLDKPFVVGDFIAVDAFDGTVEHIGLKTTRLRALSGEQIVISNADLLKSRIRNYQLLRERRQVFVLSLPYDTPPEKVARVPAIIREIVTAQPQVRFDRSHFAKFTESALNFETVYYVLTADYLTFMNIQQAVNFELLRRFADEGITFAHPTRTVVVKGGGDGATAVGAAGGA